MCICSFSLCVSVIECWVMMGRGLVFVGICIVIVLGGIGMIVVCICEVVVSY